MGNFYTAQEVAELLKIKKTTVYDLVKKNKLPATKVGKQIRINKEDLNEYLKAQVPEEKTVGVVAEPAPVYVADAADSAFTAREYLRNNTGMIVTGEEELLSLFCAYYQLKEDSIPVVRRVMNYYDSLYSLYFGKIHAAFLSLPSGEEEMICNYMMPGLRVKGVHVADLSYGLFLKKGQGSRIRRISDLSGSGLRFMMGEKGSLERILFDGAVKKENLSKKDITFVERESLSTLQGLMYMEDDQADVIVGCETYRAHFPDFDYVPLFQESLMLLYNKKYESFPAFPAMEAVLDTSSFQRRLSLMAGYDCAKSGQKVEW